MECNGITIKINFSIVSLFVNMTGEYLRCLSYLKSNFKDKYNHYANI